MSKYVISGGANYFTDNNADEYFIMKIIPLIDKKLTDTEKEKIAEYVQDIYMFGFQDGEAEKEYEINEND